MKLYLIFGGLACLKLYLIFGGLVCLVLSPLFLTSEASGQQQQIQPPQTLQSPPQQIPPPQQPQMQQQIPQQQYPLQQQPLLQPQLQQGQPLYNPNQVIACLNQVLVDSMVKAGTTPDLTLHNNTKGAAPGLNQTFIQNATNTLDLCIIPMRR